MEKIARIKLRQKTQPWGRKMPKKIKRGEAERNYGYGTWPFEVYHGYQQRDDYYRTRHHERILVMDRGGNLTNYEYEFWVGTDSDASLYATCRWCGQECKSQAERKRHIEAQKAAMGSNLLQYGEQCTMQLRRCYAILKQRGKCVACGATSSTCCWGVPLCNARCRNMFRFGYNGADRCLEEFKKA